MRVRCLLVLLFVVSASRVVAAQQIAPAGVVHRSSPDSANARYTSTRAFGVRSLTGALGFVAGVAAGVGLAAATGHSCHGCDDPGFAETLLGAGLGGALGAALGASIPKLRDRCGSGARFARAIAGSLVGTVAGVAIGVNTASATGGDVGVAVGWPIGTVLGASAALIGC